MSGEKRQVAWRMMLTEDEIAAAHRLAQEAGLDTDDWAEGIVRAAIARREGRAQ